MKTLDRYILRSFLFSALLCFVVLMSLRVVVDLFINMDEFAKLGRSFGETMGHIATYYGYQSLSYFSELGGVILVAAAAFSLARMNHTNELTAMLASGVSLYRVVWPVLICAMLLSGLIILDRELVIPPVADRLVRKRDEVPGAKSFSIKLMDDGANAVWYARKFTPAEQLMKELIVFVRDPNGRGVGDIRAAQASPGRFRGRDGWLITEATIVPYASGDAVWPNTPRSDRVFTSASPAALRRRLPEDGSTGGLSFTDAQYGGMKTEGRAEANPETGEIRILDPAFTFVVDGVELGIVFGDSAVLVSGKGRACYWQLENGRLFFASDLRAEDLELRRSRRWQSFLSVRELTRLLRLERAPDPRPVKLQIQVRVTEPINNLVLLLVGLPFILSRERNIRASVGLALLMWVSVYAFIYICRYTALPPMLAAWLPILLFGPVAAVMLDSVKT